MAATMLLMLLCSLHYSSALSPNEIAAFTNGVVINSALNATYYKISATGMPDHDTQKVNPNVHTNQNHELWIKKSPSFAAKTYCLPMGKIGIAKNGVSLFNPLTNTGENAVEGSHREIFDSCKGHPAQKGEYHYHQLPNCTYNGTVDEFIGVSLDGFAIYGPNVSDMAREITTADLDECHGRTSTINGSRAYRYYVTRQYPYLLGCFKGDIVARGIGNFDPSYVCQSSANACNCPIGPRPTPMNTAGNIQSSKAVTALVALVGFMHMYFK